MNSHNQRCEGVGFSLATCLGWTHIEEEMEGWWLKDAVHARRVSSPFKVIGLGLKHLKMQKKQATVAAQLPAPIRVPETVARG